MPKISSRALYMIGVLSSLGVLALFLAFTNAFLYEAPYAGFYFNPLDGKVAELYGEAASRGLLQPGDLLKQVGGVSIDEYRADGTVEFFKGVQPGETVKIVVKRNGEDNEVLWVLPGYTREEFLARFTNIWWLGYIFWGLGMAVQLFIRPRDIRWRLLIAFNEVTGFWLLLGPISALHVWNSSVFLHAVTWLAVPVYLNLHWRFPEPLGRIPNWVWMLVYLIFGGLTVGELLRILPRSLYFLGVLLMFGGSLILLFLHLSQPRHRRAVSLLLLSLLIVLLPSIGLGLAGLSGSVSETGMAGLLALPFMPAAYIVIIFRRQLGGMEMRANRILSVYAFLILLGTALLLLLGLAQSLDIPPESRLFLGVLTGIVTTFLAVLIFPAFQAFVDQRLLGIRLPYQNIQETYSARITTSNSLEHLCQLLGRVIFPSLLVKQFAFLQFEHGEPKTLLAESINGYQLPDENDLLDLLASPGRYIPVSSAEEHSGKWIRLVLPLRVGADLIGVWLLGRRDPDDLYSQREIPILQALANQTAVAMSNLLQTERLRKMYQDNINNFEEHRLGLALDLHDSILNQLAVLRMNLDETHLSPNFYEAYEALTARLREIVSDLRPPMLNYGLKPALDELAENLMERTNDAIKVTVNVQAEEGVRYPANIELHLFRIVQEACENTLHHAKAGEITFSGRMDSEGVNLVIEDNGIGFEAGERLELSELLSHKHFGLAGMIERGALIHAKVRIESIPQKGTRIQVMWNSILAETDE
ncbi:MAG: ATP-binding protein [Chloroflexota bacterium]